MKVIAVIEPACADTADRRRAVIWQILDHLRLSTVAPSFRAPPHQPREWSYDPPLTCLCVARRQATFPSPIRCAHCRGRGTGLSRLIFPSLKTRKIPLDPPLRWC